MNSLFHYFKGISSAYYPIIFSTPATFLINKIYYSSGVLNFKT